MDQAYNFKMHIENDAEEVSIAAMLNPTWRETLKNRYTIFKVL